MATDSHSPSIAVVGVHGYGRTHVAAVERLHRAGRARLVGLCDTRPVTGAAFAGDPAWYPDHRSMLERIRPDIVVIATPPAAHLAIAGDAARAGADILLEKPPLLSRADQDELGAVLSGTGQVCQVGFQTLGSGAFLRLRTAVAAGVLGTITSVTATGRRAYRDEYYQRAGWAGRRAVDGRSTGDGALTNPFAHAVMNCLSLATAGDGGQDVTRIRSERYRCRDIEVDDTSCLSVDVGPVRCLIAVTLCAEQPAPTRIVVSGTAGRAELEFEDDRLRMPGTPWTTVGGGLDLLENLIAHRREGAELIAPLHRTAPFIEVLEAVVGGPPAHAVAASYLDIDGTGDQRRVRLRGVDAVTDRAAADLLTFADQHLGWTVPTTVA